MRPNHNRNALAGSLSCKYTGMLSIGAHSYATHDYHYGLIHFVLFLEILKREVDEEKHWPPLISTHHNGPYC